MTLRSHGWMRWAPVPALILFSVKIGAAAEAEPARPPSFVRSAWPGTINSIPRPNSGAADVSPETSLYFELAPGKSEAGKLDPIDISTLRVTLHRGEKATLLLEGEKWMGGAKGQLFQASALPAGVNLDDFNAQGLDAGLIAELLAQPNTGVYLVPPAPLEPSAGYSVTVECRSRSGAGLAPDWFGWKFTTRAAPPADPVKLAGNVSKTVRWGGQIFAGILKPNFDSSRLFHQLDTYDLMAAAKGPGPLPAVGSLQRDWPLCSDGWMNGLFDGNPNLVRERETRLITGLADAADATVLTLADLPEGPLYGIEPNRALGVDYQAGDEVLVADTTHSERGVVLSIDEALRRVRVKPLERKAAGWKVVPTPHFPPDDPATPDNFPYPGAYLRKFKPCGTPVYYWARMDHEWDLLHLQYGRRLVVNFEETPCDLSADGVPGNDGGGGSPGPPKDWAEWHEFVRRVAARVLERYGEAGYGFYWSIGNEPDLRPIFWRAGDEEFIKWYDFTADAIARAFEDRGLDSARARIGGVELGALAGEPPLLALVLEHCSPLEGKLGALERNFAVAEHALDGRRSRRVEALCAANGGRGSPCDWISLHQYKLVTAAIAQLTWARRTALAIDPAYFDRLWVNSYEACPDWNPGRDPATRAMYNGSGYFVAWCADWSARQVRLAAEDPRFARHEALLTVWPFDHDLDGRDSLTALLRVDQDGDGKSDRIETVRKDILNYLECVGRMPGEYFSIGEARAGPVALGGFGARDQEAVYAILHGHDPGDVEGRGEKSFDAVLTLDAFPFEAAMVESFPIDRDRNSFYPVAEALLAKGPRAVFSPEEVARLREAARLKPAGPPARATAASGGPGARTLSIPVRLPANGVLFLVMKRA
jgi:glycosyl hydrolase family 39 (putative alpha-L-iduronidase)